MIIHKKKNKFVEVSTYIKSSKVVNLIDFNRCFYHCGNCFPNKINVVFLYSSPQPVTEKQIQKRIDRYFGKQ